MRRWVPGLLVLAAFLGAALALGPFASTHRAGTDFRLDVFFIAGALISIDLIDLIVRVYFRHVHTSPLRATRVAPVSWPIEVGEFTPYQMRLHLRPYAIVTSVHNLPQAELEEFLHSLEPFRDRVWIIDDASTDDTWERLQRTGVHVVRGAVNRKKPGALRELIAALPAEVRTVVVFDPDARILHNWEEQIHDFERVLFEFQRSRHAALCPRVVVRRDGLVAQFQELEYAMACGLGRKSLGDHCVTSGVSVYRRDALERVLGEHTLSVYAEDLQNSVLLLSRGERIYYDGRFVVETDGKRTWSALFSQRVGWFYGLIKVYSENLGAIFRMTEKRPIYIYQFVVYAGVFGILLHPVKLLALGILAASAANTVDQLLGLSLIPDGRFTDPAYFLLCFAKCQIVLLLAILLGVPRRERRWLLPVVPLYFFYAYAHVLPITVGYLNWIAVKLGFRRLYQDHYQNEADLQQDEMRRKAG